MSYLVLTDEDVVKLSSMENNIKSIKLAFKERINGTLVSPPRFNLETNKGNLVFTAGASTDYAKVLGFRVYDTFRNSEPNHEQLVCVYDSESGVFKGIIIGHLVGAIRTGAIGGLAVDLMAREDSTELGIVGTGFQANTQLEAILAVRKSIKKIRIFSRNLLNREKFGRVIKEKHGIDVITCDSSKDCVENADIIICATTSRTPVIDSKWIKAGAHISTIGPKAVNGHEIPIEVAKRSQVIATDSLEQLNGYKTPHFLSNVSNIPDILDLSDLMKQGFERNENDITLFCSVGLSGTEVVVANEMIEQYNKLKK